MSPAAVLERAKAYQCACYLVWLERPDIPLDTPPRDSGEELVIGEHIRSIGKLTQWFSANNHVLPQRQDYPEHPWGVAD